MFGTCFFFLCPRIMVRKRAFTIWELLCVIAVLVLLISLLLPSLNRARSTASRVMCSANLRSLGTAGITYLSDNQGMFPDPMEWLYRKASVSEAHPAGCRWHDAEMGVQEKTVLETKAYQGEMWSYYSDGWILLCPLFREYSEDRGCENARHIPDLAIVPQFNYSMNGYLGTTREGGVLHESKVRNPNEVFFFAEENSWSVRPDHPKYPARNLKRPLSTQALGDSMLLIRRAPEAEDCFGTYHSVSRNKINEGSGNVLFVDGHAEMISAKEQMGEEDYRGKGLSRRGGNFRMAWADAAEPPGGWEDGEPIGGKRR